MPGWCVEAPVRVYDLGQCLWHEKDELISCVLASQRAEARDADRAAAAGNEVLTQDNEPEVGRTNNGPIL